MRLLLFNNENHFRKFPEHVAPSYFERLCVTLVCTIFLNYLIIILFLSYLYIFFPQRAANSLQAGRYPMLLRSVHDAESKWLRVFYRSTKPFKFFRYMVYG